MTDERQKIQILKKKHKILWINIYIYLNKIRVINLNLIIFINDERDLLEFIFIS
jgi:hypothetical protein